MTQPGPHGTADLSFAEEVAASFPAGITLPEEFRRLFDWMEANGFVRTSRHAPRRFALLYPASMGEEISSVAAFEPVDAEHARHWTGVADPAVTGRLAPFIRTGGDGSYAALWRDDAGRQHFVHMGSGSGSGMMGTLVGGAADMLRLLAIGYREPAFPECYHLVPEEEVDTYGPRFVPPLLFRAWVERELGVTVPARGTEVVRAATAAPGDDPEDPFLRWLDAAQSAAEGG